jgi:glycosyltransferase involved in cell wall biosynthesis
MRVLFLASYFPRPAKPLIGTWALEQARALVNLGDVRVVCCTPYVPRILGILPRAKGWVNVPLEHVWPPTRSPATDPPLPATAKGVHTTYLQGLFYPIPPFKRWAYSNPRRQMNMAWRSIRDRLLRIVDQFQPQVVFAHHTAVNGYFAERIRQLRPIPFVVTDHDFFEISDCDHLPRRRAMFERIKMAASTNVCVSQRMENDTRRIFPNARAQTVHNGINPLPADIFSTPRPAELRDRQIVLSVGMFTPRKGFPLLIEAFKSVAEKHPRAVLRIIGDGKDRPAIEAAITQHGLADKVALLGLQPSHQVFQEMAWADLFALVSWDEPFATVFIEAMGAGIPVITASDGGITDVVRHGVHGLIVPPKDAVAAASAMNELLADDARRRAMGAQARALVENQLTWSANAQRMFALFNEAIQSPGRSVPT